MWKNLPRRANPPCHFDPALIQSASPGVSTCFRNAFCAFTSTVPLEEQQAEETESDRRPVIVVLADFNCREAECFFETVY